MDFYGFYTGQEFEAYKYLGAHYTKERTTFPDVCPLCSGRGACIKRTGTRNAAGA